MTVTTRRIRSNAEPIILSSTREVTGRHEGREFLPRNIILTVARDCWARDTRDWAYDLLFATQILRMAYDSPRIGGGIDPNVATGVPGIETGREESYMLGYIIGSETCDEEHFDPESMGTLDGYTPDQIQDMIVHAEAVALLTLAVTEEDR